ncbi:transferrin-binding protein-like solute binding protein [Zavarzinia compransoris]|uniref:transferrin-binding protein-like solute binding protein n=1 Tax=Zavarzinia marina TaxID=2911065 RepID=UPI001F29FBCB|nr:transferrin-binding protein-like solute binding protein [Zavarzinia marina]MCF4164068.1 transferrin-binding protein-like solute binding protein [Zavarzinia marina]
MLFFLGAVLGLAACTGGGGGGSAPAPAPAPAPTITSFSAVLPASGTTTVSPAQTAAGFNGGTVPAVVTGIIVAAGTDVGTLPGPFYIPGGSTELPGTLDPIPEIEPVTFPFSEASLSRIPGSAEGFVVEMRESLPGGPDLVVGASISAWAPLDELMPGLKIGVSDSGWMSGVQDVLYDPPDGTEINGLALDGAGTVDLSHMSFAYWILSSMHPDETEFFLGMSGGAIGSVSPDLTTIAALPATAVYNGTTVGGVVVEGAGAFFTFAGDIRLRADFGAGAMSAQVTGLKFFDSATVDASLTGETIDFDGIAIDAANASFAGSTDSGMTVGFSGEALNGSGAMAGNFFGPNATEAGGTWGLQEHDTETGFTELWTGAFGAAR